MRHENLLDPDPNEIPDPGPTNPAGEEVGDEEKPDDTDLEDGKGI